MSVPMLEMETGAVVVFEGLDRTGKSTQVASLKLALARESVMFGHMPSGFTSFTQTVYRTLESSPEDGGPASGLARQLAHLACHADSMGHLVEARRTRGLVLDRWWWSTLAYGVYAGAVRSAGLSEADFRALVQSIWAPIDSSVVFLFMTPHQVDRNNRDEIARGYFDLASEHSGRCVIVPPGSEQEVHAAIIAELVQRGLASMISSAGASL